MRSVDTNVLVRLLTRDDPKQAAAADRFIENGAWVSMLVLAETIWVLTSVYEVSPLGITTCLEMLLNHKKLIVQEADTIAAALTLLRSRPTLEFSDCLILELSRRSGHVPLGTLDRSLSKADGADKI